MFRSSLVGAAAPRARHALGAAYALCAAIVLAVTLLGSNTAEAAVGETTGYMNQRFLHSTSVKPSLTGKPSRVAKRRSGKIAKQFRKRFKTKTAQKKSRGVKVAALGKEAFTVQPPTAPVTGNGIRWAASSGCLNGTLIAVIYQVASNFGPVTVNSTCRSRGHNARVGGARRSHHLTGNAADFRVHGNVRVVYAYLRSTGSVGGLKHYGGGLFHIDTGERRSW